MAKFRIIILLLLCLVAPVVQAQQTFRIVEWNVENAFDTCHDEGKNDQEFLPDGSHHWTRSRYWRKLDEISKTIVALGDTLGLPPVVGLVEVENDTVLHDLTRRSPLRTAGYRYVMTDSPDIRGVDVALLYHPAHFRLLNHHSIRVPSAEHGFRPTRDILYASGLLTSGDTLHLLVCHLPSKAGGVKNAGKHRKLVIQTLRSAIDSVLALCPTVQLAVLGDFNATPRESTFKQLCPPLRETLPTSRRELNRPIGTYLFQGLWSYLDHILVSPAVHTRGKAQEARLPHLLEEDGRPNRTYLGPNYHGGISDHLPLYLDIAIP